jgi:hypothetical protein
MPELRSTNTISSRSTLIEIKARRLSEASRDRHKDRASCLGMRFFDIAIVAVGTPDHRSDRKALIPA